MPSGGWEVRRGLAAALFVLLPLAAHGEDWSGSYLCLPEFGGGVAYDEAAQKWEGTVFRPNGRFVMKATYAREEPWSEGSDLMVQYYSVSISEFGEGAKPIACTEADGLSIPASLGGFFGCNASLTDYRINLATMRYLAIYPVGYVSGQDNNDNTPSIMGGTCARID